MTESKPPEHLVSYNDVFLIISNAKDRMANVKFPISIGSKELDLQEATHVVVMEAMVMYLNRNNLLNKHIKFDYRK